MSWWYTPFARIDIQNGGVVILLWLVMVLMTIAYFTGVYAERGELTWPKTIKRIQRLRYSIYCYKNIIATKLRLKVFKRGSRKSWKKE